jgi:DNA-binding transcriptional ArsR family regulator
MKNLAHSASFQPCEKIAPSKSGIKQFGVRTRKPVAHWLQRLKIALKGLGSRRRKLAQSMVEARLHECLAGGVARSSQPAVSKHLGVLKQAGLVRDRHEGRQTHYSAQLGALALLIDWTGEMAEFWQSRFDDLEDLLKRMDQ